MTAFITFIKNDWWIAFPMFFMSIAGLTLVIWRILLNMHANTDLNVFLPEFKHKLDREGVDSALRYCRDRQDLIAKRLFTAGLEVSKQGMAASRRAMANAIELEILPDLNFLLPSILAIAKIATMVGLLGTVISMIGTFNSISTGKGDVGAQAGSIGLALFATALGLVTAIPLVFAHVLFKAWVAKFEVRMKSAAQKLLVYIQNRPAGGKDGAAVPGAAAPAVKPGVDPSSVTPRR